MLTVVTPFRGKIKLIARGVRKITSRRAGNVELLNRVKLHIFAGSGMPVLTEAESIETYPKIKGDLTLSAYGSYVAEIIDRLAAENQPNPALFKLLLEVLGLLETAPRQIFVRAFEVKVLATSGFWSPDEIQTDEPTKKLLDQLCSKGWEDIGKMDINQKQAIELERILRYYMEKVLESPLKSARIIEKLKG